LCHVYPTDSNFTETKFTLEYALRCRIGENKLIKTPEGPQSLFSVGMMGSDKTIKKLNDEIGELKLKLESTHRDYKMRFNNLRTIMGLDIDLEKMSLHSGSKETK